MKMTLRLFLFLIAFQLEVRVRASGEVLQQPDSCLKDKSACAIQVVGDSFKFTRGSLKLVAAQDSTLARIRTKVWRFIKGTLWVQESDGLKVETVFGSLSADRGQFWVLDQGSNVLVRNVDSDLKIHLRDGKRLELPEGFEVWISGINSRGQTEYGVLRPIDIKAHLPVWNSLYEGSKEEFIRDVTKTKEFWGDLAEKSSRIYSGLVQRELASYQEKKDALEKGQNLKQEKQRKTRQLYWQKVFEQ